MTILKEKMRADHQNLYELARGYWKLAESIIYDVNSVDFTLFFMVYHENGAYRGKFTILGNINIKEAYEDDASSFFSLLHRNIDNIQLPIKKTLDQRNKEQQQVIIDRIQSIEGLALDLYVSQLDSMKTQFGEIYHDVNRILINVNKERRSSVRRKVIFRTQKNTKYNSYYGIGEVQSLFFRDTGPGPDIETLTTNTYIDIWEPTDIFKPYVSARVESRIGSGYVPNEDVFVHKPTVIMSNLSNLKVNLDSIDTHPYQDYALFDNLLKLTALYGIDLTALNVDDVMLINNSLKLYLQRVGL